MDFIEEEKWDNFFDESFDMIKEFEERITELEKFPTSKNIDALFENVYTLKSLFITTEINEVILLIHEIENLLDKIRSGLLVLSKAVFRVLFEAQATLQNVNEILYENCVRDNELILRKINRNWLEKLRGMINGFLIKR